MPGMVTVTFYSSAPTMLQISASDMPQDLSITYIWKRRPKQWSNILNGISEQSEVRKIFSGHLFSDDLFSVANLPLGLISVAILFITKVPTVNDSKARAITETTVTVLHLHNNHSYKLKFELK